MSTRKELISATKLRYRTGTPAEKRTILEEFVGLTGYHRKHAIRILNQTNKLTERKPRDRTYDAESRRTAGARGRTQEPHK